MPIISFSIFFICVVLRGDSLADSGYFMTALLYFDTEDDLESQL